MLVSSPSAALNSTGVTIPVGYITQVTGGGGAGVGGGSCPQFGLDNPNPNPWAKQLGAVRQVWQPAHTHTHTAGPAQRPNLPQPAPRSSGAPVLPFPIGFFVLHDGNPPPAPRRRGRAPPRPPPHPLVAVLLAAGQHERLQPARHIQRVTGGAGGRMAGSLCAVCARDVCVRVCMRAVHAPSTNAPTHPTQPTPQSASQGINSVASFSRWVAVFVCGGGMRGGLGG